MGKDHRQKNHYKGDFFGEGGGSAASSESLDEYIRVGKPGTLVVLAALLIVLAAVIIWGLIGKLPVTETVKGLVLDPQTVTSYYEDRDLPEKLNALLAQDAGKKVIYCFIDASRFNGEQIRNFGEQAVLEMPDHSKFTGSIETRVGVPLSTEQCKSLLFGNEWAAQKCVQTDYSWWLIIDPDQDLSEYEFMLSNVTLVTEEVAPITFLAG